MRKVGKSKESKVVNNSLLNDPCIDQTSPWEYSHILVEFTLAILKPDVEAYHDDIEGIIHEKGFSIIHVCFEKFWILLFYEVVALKLTYIF